MNTFSKISVNRPQINFSIKDLLEKCMRLLAGNEQIQYSNGEITLFYSTAFTFLILLVLLFFFI